MWRAVYCDLRSTCAEARKTTHSICKMKPQAPPDRRQNWAPGRPAEPQNYPKSTPNRPKIDKKSIKNRFWEVSRVLPASGGAPGRPQRAPGRPKIVPGRSQERPRPLPRGPGRLPGAPGERPESVRDALGAPPDTTRTRSQRQRPREALLQQFLVDFGASRHSSDVDETLLLMVFRTHGACCAPRAADTQKRAKKHVFRPPKSRNKVPHKTSCF